MGVVVFRRWRVRRQEWGRGQAWGVARRMAAVAAAQDVYAPVEAAEAAFWEAFAANQDADGARAAAEQAAFAAAEADAAFWQAFLAELDAA